jgi:hypothetical protein
MEPFQVYSAKFFRNAIPLPTLVCTLSRILRRMRALLVLLSLWCTCCEARPQKDKGGDQARNGIFKKINIITYFMHVPNRICFAEITKKCAHPVFLGSASYAGRKMSYRQLAALALYYSYTLIKNISGKLRTIERKK